MTACLKGSHHDLRYILTCKFSNTAGRHGHCICRRSVTWGMILKPTVTRQSMLLTIKLDMGLCSILVADMVVVHCAVG